MKKSFFVLSSLAIFILTTLDARVYKGQKEYIEKCKKCHDNGEEIVFLNDKHTWKKIMKSNGENLAKLHLESKKAEDSWKYFKSKNYQKKSKHLKDFLVEYAKDSAKVPALD